MPNNYNHLGSDQRYRIEAFLKAGMSQKAIAKEIGVHPSTISRELKRNTPARGCLAGQYLAFNAQRRTLKRHQEKPKYKVFDDAMKLAIKHSLVNERWSPEFISHCHNAVSFSHEWIYKWIWSCKFSKRVEDQPFTGLYEYLRHGRRRRKRGNRRDNRGVIPNRTPIEARPKIVSKRSRVGDVEVDLMMGKNHKGAVLVMTDRATLHTRLWKLKNKEAATVQKAATCILESITYPVRTLTFDNDKAFSCHGEISNQFNIRSYFTRPYTSQDKGTVENRIGVIRRFFPKGTDLTTVSQCQISRVENLINNRPVRKFNYLTPNQVLQGKIALIC